MKKRIEIMVNRIEKESIELYFKEACDYRNVFEIKNDLQYTYEFRHINSNSASVYFKDKKYLEEAIDEFRFYSFHITFFYDINKRIIKIFDEVKLFKLKINQIQPSQFYISKTKLEDINKMITDDFYFPIANINDQFILCDGHTRLFFLSQRGIDEVNCYLDSSSSDYLKSFADGNGRMGGLWQTLILSKFNFLFEYLPIETLIRKKQEEYYSAINYCQKSNDSTLFIEFMLEIIFETLKDFDKNDQVTDQVRILLSVFKEQEYSFNHLM